MPWQDRKVLPIDFRVAAVILDTGVIASTEAETLAIAGTFRSRVRMDFLNDCGSLLPRQRGK